MVHSMHEVINVENMNLSYYCRGCKLQVRGIPLTNPQYQISEIHDDPWLICRCPTPACELSFVIYDKLNSEVRWVYPLPSFDADDFHEAIPEKVREDLAEGRRCFYAGAYKGAVTMYRRAVQSIVLNKITDPSIKTKELWQQIDELFKQGFITASLKDTAHEIRHFGNFGAHPSDDALDKTTRNDAEIISNLVGDLVVAIYVTPYEAEKLKKKRVPNASQNQ